MIVLLYCVCLLNQQVYARNLLDFWWKFLQAVCPSWLPSVSIKACLISGQNVQYVYLREGKMRSQENG